MRNLKRAGKHIPRRLVRGGSVLAKEKGVWVFRAGRPLPASVTNNLLDEIRAERDKRTALKQSK